MGAAIGIFDGKEMLFIYNLYVFFLLFYFSSDVPYRFGRTTMVSE